MTTFAGAVRTALHARACIAVVAECALPAALANAAAGRTSAMDALHRRTWVGRLSARRAAPAAVATALSIITATAVNAAVDAEARTGGQLAPTPGTPGHRGTCVGT